METNKELALKYIKAEEEAGIKRFDLEIHSDNDVELLRVYDVVGEDSIEIPKFITRYNKGDLIGDNRMVFYSTYFDLATDSSKKYAYYGPFIGTRYKKVIIDADLDTYDMLFSYMKSDELEVEITRSNKVKSMDRMFIGCSDVKRIKLLGLDTSEVESMCGVFFSCDKLEVIDGIRDIDTKRVKNMSNLFSFCFRLRSIDISQWDTSNVEDMEGMFAFCSTIKRLDINKLDTSKVKSMRSMFSGCKGLTYINLNGLDTRNVEDMVDMFSMCDGLVGLDINSFNTSKVKSMDNMFSRCSRLKELDLSNFDVSLATKGSDICSMFTGCKDLCSVDIRLYDLEALRVKYMLPTELSVLRLLFSDSKKLSLMDINYKI